MILDFYSTAAYADCGDKSRWKDPKYRYILKENEDIK